MTTLQPLYADASLPTVKNWLLGQLRHPRYQLDDLGRHTFGLQSPGRSSQGDHGTTIITAAGFYYAHEADTGEGAPVWSVDRVLEITLIPLGTKRTEISITATPKAEPFAQEIAALIRERWPAARSYQPRKSPLRTPNAEGKAHEARKLLRKLPKYQVAEQLRISQPTLNRLLERFPETDLNA